MTDGLVVGYEGGLLKVDEPDGGPPPVVDEQQRGADHLNIRRFL